MLLETSFLKETKELTAMAQDQRIGSPSVEKLERRSQGLSIPNTPRSTSRLTTPSSSDSCTPRSTISTVPTSASLLSIKMDSWNGHSVTTSYASSSSEYGPASSIVTPRKIVSPMVSSKARAVLRNLGNRDKESMFEEIVQLKKELIAKDTVLQRHKVRETNIEAENRKLAQDIDALEGSLNLEGPRTGSPRRLRAKIAGLKGMLDEVQATCEAQAEELFHLRRDVRLTRFREIEVERDVFASEMRRLQTMVKRLKIVNFKMGHENCVVGRLKAKIHHLEVVNQRLSCGLSSNFCPSTPSSAVGDGRYGKVHTPRSAIRPFVELSVTPRTPLSDRSTLHQVFTSSQLRIQLPLAEQPLVGNAGKGISSGLSTPRNPALK